MAKRPTHRCPLTDIKRGPHRRRKISISSRRREASMVTGRRYGDIKIYLRFYCIDLILVRAISFSEWSLSRSIALNQM